MRDSLDRDSLDRDSLDRDSLDRDSRDRDRDRQTTNGDAMKVSLGVHIL